MRPIPALAYIPLVIVWVGIGEPSRIIIIALAVFKPCVVNARAGMQEVAQIYVDAARTLGASQWRVFTTVALPSAIPYFIAGLRTGVSTGFLALVAAELIAAPSGLGLHDPERGPVLPHRHHHRRHHRHRPARRAARPDREPRRAQR